MKNREPDIEFVEHTDTQDEQYVSLLGVLKKMNNASWGQIISQHLYFIIWLTFLGMVYIGNRYHAEHIARQTASLTSQVNELRAESITTANELMNMSRESVVAGMVRERGLKIEEAGKPPYILK